ncbi:hypothetical protein HFV04_021705 [Pseudomonas sp. BIGb0427]|uniref:hypothetical protein n=1 Tax=Pseudomonas sp. BIGb0427 TaxID=2724470 RepID=UPI0018A7851F|nr:hypothetical protein [Pseudomonas sp. BIGb0427]QPG62118.1 hypothetical protein HFV04_021705 [Pseudomonas sp. BIGb0427]
MNWVLVANVGSLVFGVLSAAFWVASAIAKAPPPPGFENSPDGDFWKASIFNGGDLRGTMRLQAKWNSRAAFAAAAAVLLQVLTTLLQS